MTQTKAVLSLVAVAAGAVLIPAQQNSEPGEGGVTFRAETALMEVEVRVIGGGGRPVPGLTKDDFTLSENGESQTIATLEYVAEPTEEAAIRLPGVPAQAEESEQRQSDARSALLRQAAALRATRVLIVSHVGPGEVKRVRQAVRKFIEKDLAPGVLVSLDGAAFTDDKQLLLDLLAGRIKAADLPGRPFRADVQAGTDFSEQDQLEQQEKGFGSMKEGYSNIIQDQEGRSHLFRYVDIARGLGKYPGKKMLVLFSRGLALGYSRYQGALHDRGVITDRGMFVNLDNTGLMRRLRAETMRARIQFYVVDARGLDALDRPATAAHSNLGIEASGASPRVLRQQMLMLAPTAGLGEDSHMSRQGLRMLAEQTGGKVVLNTNDLGHVFELVKEDMHGYYLLGYYPPEREDDGFRKVKVEVRQAGVKLSYRKGYYGESLEKFVEAQDRAAATSATTEHVPKAAVKAYREALTVIQTQPVDLEKVLEWLHRATEVHPDFALAWNLAGYVESVRGNEHEAKGALERAITADASFESPRRHLMRLLDSTQDWTGAETAANGLLALRPDDAEARYYLGVAQFNQRNDDAALATVEAALRAGHADEYPALLRIHGDLLSKSGDTAGAAEAYRQFLDAEPDSPQTDTLRQRIERGEQDAVLREIHADVQAGNWPLVVEQSGAVLADHPDWTAVKVFLALGRFNLGQLAEAEKLAREVTSTEAAERFPEARYVLGLALAEQGDVQAAMEEYRGFLTLRPDSPLANEVRETLADWETLLELD